VQVRPARFIKRLFGIGAFATATVCLVAAENVADTEISAQWRLESESNGVLIYSRTRSGFSAKEFRAIGLIDAPPDRVFAVVDDAEAYPSFMPFTAETRVLKRSEDYLIAYQRLKLPFVADRDYTIVSTHKVWRGGEAPIHQVAWTTANEFGPGPQSGVRRVQICEGSWLLEREGKNATRAIYQIYTDSGGSIPAIIANSGSRIAICKIFEAIRKQVKQPKYAKN
jgi:Polyketide cyclase / dehydrase and lipid transport